jgi:hypothetical protein
MNPYLDLLKMKKCLATPLTKLTKDPSVSSVSDHGTAFQKIDPSQSFEPKDSQNSRKRPPRQLTKLTKGPSVSSVSKGDSPFSKIDGADASTSNSPEMECHDLVREFMEVDGLSLEEAQALAAVSVAPRPATEWLAMIAELDTLIAAYCEAFKLSDEAHTHIADVRNRQSLMTIPHTLDWFRRELKNAGNSG